MATPFQPWWLDIEQFEETMVVRFTRREPLDEETAYALGHFLSGLVEERGRHLVLNFGRLEYVNSLIVGRLLALNKRLAAQHGRLTLCGVTAQLRELFELIRLPLLIPIYEDEDEALEALTSLKTRLVKPRQPRSRPATTWPRSREILHPVN